MATSEVTAYFAWHKFPGNRTYRQTESLKSYLGDRWNNLSIDEQEEIIDDYFVDSEIRHHYRNEASASEFPPSFPKLMIPNGEKIMVDENDLRTWRDAHSGPFSWKSKSQQDLTLSDFEPENLYKPPTKGKKPKSGSTETEAEETVPENLAPAQFVYIEEKWTSELLSEYQTYLDTRTSKPPSRASSPLEEDNPAFEGSVQDVRETPRHGTSECSGSIISDQSRSERSGSVISESVAHSETSEKAKKTKSPIPKKVTFSKSEIDIETTEKLIIKETADEANNAFSNPVMANEWSTFVGQESQDMQEEPVTEEPPAMTMDRGMESSDHSVESTPDHTAKLLPNQPDLSEVEQEEVLFVAVETSNEMSASDLRKSGFDFLDNW
ncbi:uncharacterized protein C1orf198 homolog isoform X2 [Haliotis asinina]|uniref:uncharacterized protein C1orf198 homolog isoform X2 n=1 Tax=Haliotis asinina TaxID=109174 RepID=UPI003531BC6C